MKIINIKIYNGTSRNKGLVLRRVKKDERFGGIKDGEIVPCDIKIPSQVESIDYNDTVSVRKCDSVDAEGKSQRLVSSRVNRVINEIKIIVNNGKIDWGPCLN